MTTLQKLGIETELTFPRIRELRGKHSMTYEELANAFGASFHATAKHRLANGNFTPDEMIALVNHFNSLGEKETINTLFFDWIFTNVKEKEPNQKIEGRAP